MDRTRIWPDFREEHILFEDADLLAVHKPAGVPTQAADPERPDDVVTRLRAFLAARDGKPASAVYLGVHQRLDRDTSGVLVLTKRSEANAGLAAQLEGRKVVKHYLAGVTGWPAGAARRTLDDRLVRDPDGRMSVLVAAGGRRGAGGGPRAAGRRPAPPPAPRAPERGAVRAVTHVRRATTRGERALLELVLETGRTHQARVQLAHAGAPIAGDPLYGPHERTAPAPRLMLHAAAIELEHPTTGRPLSIRDDRARPAFEAWLAHGDPGFAVYDDPAELARRLGLAVERRWGLGRSADRDPDERATTAFRLVHEEADALPGLAVDVYDGHLVAQIYVSEEWEASSRRERLLDALDALGFDGVYLKLRPKQANVLVDTRRDDLAPSTPVRGLAAADPLLVREEGTAFPVRLGDGLSTGIFLDQRKNRRAVREMARGLRVANLFSYTCAFSLFAALGGARETVSVDASLAALERGREAFAHHGIALGRVHTFVGEDVFAWLARTAKKAEARFDLVIVDPPSYSSTKKRRFVAESDYGDLVAMACAIVAPGGRILASCNHRGMARAKLRRLVHEGVRAARRTAVQLKDMPDGPDFPAPPGRDPFMKTLLLRLD